MSEYTITFRVKKNGSLANADSLPVLRDATNTYGIRRVDTEEVVVGVTPSPQAFTLASTGIYTFTFDEAVLDVTYQYAIEAVVNGATYRKVDTFTITSDAVDIETTPSDSEIDDKIRQSLANPLSAAADGQSATQHNLRDQIAAAEWLKKQQAAESGQLGGVKILKILGPGMD